MGAENLPAVIAGVRLGAAAAGIRQSGRDDLAVVELPPDTTVAAVFTRNAFAAAPVQAAREHLRRATPRWLLFNSGNANAATGEQGLRDARHCCAHLAELAGARPEEVLPFSTGLIGEALPVDKLCAALPRALEQRAEDGWERVARAIMTTDTCPKTASGSLSLASGPAHLCGMAKGAGMIRPDMATMLAFIATEVRAPSDCLQRNLELAVERSFNRISVDSDTSTNDSCVLAATGTGPEIIPGSADEDAFRTALEALCLDLARQILADGEGVERVFAVEVRGGTTAEECLAVGRAIADSPLVKTAVHAGDPNWGRILAAAGRAGVSLTPGEVSLFLGEVPVFCAGERVREYTEEQGRQAMQGREICIRLDLGRGECSETVHGTELSAEYVRINAEYRS